MSTLKPRIHLRLLPRTILEIIMAIQQIHVVAMCSVSEHSSSASLQARACWDLENIDVPGYLRPWTCTINDVPLADSRWELVNRSKSYFAVVSSSSDKELGLP